MYSSLHLSLSPPLSLHPSLFSSEEQLSEGKGRLQLCSRESRRADPTAWPGEKCPHFRGCCIQVLTDWTCEDVSLLNRCLYFSVFVLQTVQVLGEEEDGWWRGQVGDKLGLFHSNFVEIITKETTPPAAPESCSAAPPPNYTNGALHLPTDRPGMAIIMISVRGGVSNISLHCHHTLSLHHFTSFFYY